MSAAGGGDDEVDRRRGDSGDGGTARSENHKDLASLLAELASEKFCVRAWRGYFPTVGRNDYTLGLDRGVAQPGSASALGAEGPQFKSGRPDQENIPLSAASSSVDRAAAF